MARPNSPPSTFPSRNGAGIAFALSFTALSLVAVYAIRIAAVQSGVSEKMELIRAAKAFSEYSLDHRAPFAEHPMPLRTTYTGIAPLDQGFTFLVSAFMNGVAGWDPGFFVFTIYFLVSFFAIITIWSIEACRERNRGALTRFTYIFALFYQTVGGAIIIPIYYLVWLYDTSSNSYWSKPRQVPLNYAKALLPALLIGYLLPTVLMFLPYSTPNMWTTQAMVALWQPCPWFVDSLIWLFSKLTSSTSGTNTESPKKRPTDTAHLDRIYLISALTTTAAHILILYLTIFSSNPRHSFAALFLHPTAHSGAPMTMVQGMHAIFQADYWIIFGASLIWAFQAVYDLKSLGRTDVSLWVAAAWTVGGTLLIGPGTVITAVWWWREGKLVEAEGKGQGKKEK